MIRSHRPVANLTMYAIKTYSTALLLMEMRTELTGAKETFTAVEKQSRQTHERTFAEKHFNPTLYERLAQSIRRVVYKTVNTFSPAPEIKGIERSLQQEGHLQLILTRLKVLAGIHISFEDIKRMTLSNKNSLYKSYNTERELVPEIDPELIELTRLVNSNPNMFSIDSCTGHIISNPENPDEQIYSGGGYFTFISRNTGESETIEAKLKEHCIKMEETKRDFKYRVHRVTMTYGWSAISVTWTWTPVEREDARNSLNKIGCPGLTKWEKDEIARSVYRYGKAAKEKGVEAQTEEFIRSLEDIFI